jgi:hypothetical protein
MRVTVTISRRLCFADHVLLIILLADKPNTTHGGWQCVLGNDRLFRCSLFLQPANNYVSIIILTSTE